MIKHLTNYTPQKQIRQTPQHTDNTEQRSWKRWKTGPKVGSNEVLLNHLENIVEPVHWQEQER